MVSSVNSHTNASSKRWHLWETDLRFALNSTTGWHTAGVPAAEEEGEHERENLDKGFGFGDGVKSLGFSVEG